ncbi:hypothetical protein Cni_G04263 [Canna indica]|uniref:p-hydroxybenzoic acid efflux pump subunit aaeB n=1 Tax=Canna indica TaxID=4628 RepID=A0AAQ3JT24_9LILI|nr:hypothetical protein Cni_G04263 [Canna indica]
MLSSRYNRPAIRRVPSSIPGNSMQSKNKVITSSAMSLPASLRPLEHSCSLWRSRIGFALRAALACVLIGVATVYGPAGLRSFVTYPAFSYVTAVLVVGEATLGDSVHGIASALCATLLGAVPAMLTLVLTPGKGFSVASTTLTVSLSAFVVALPEATSLVTKRIALGQIIIIYVATSNQVIHFGHPEAMLHPVHVAASTALGVAASLVASLFPYPRLARYEISKQSKAYKQMVIERLRLLVNAFFADDKSCKATVISQLRSLTSASTKVLRNIKLKQANQNWERNPLKLLSTPSTEPSEELQAIEAALEGMEMALSSMTAMPGNFLDQQFKRDMMSLRNLTSLSLIQNNYLIDKWEAADNALQPLILPPQDPKHLPAFFFLFCLFHLHHQSLTPPSLEAGQENKIMPTTEQAENSCKDEEPTTKRSLISMPSCVSFRRERLVVALKCSLSLGLAVFLGLLFSKENAFWAGLTVATTIAPWRESTFKLANLRAQGTAVGSIYGVLGALISQNLMELRFLVLVPWIMLTSFLQRSRMYGPAGGTAAVISGILILGRRDYGPPSAFVIARLTETFIGLSSMVAVELLLQPVRASTLARESLSHSLRMLNEFMESLAPSTSSAALRAKEMTLRQRLNALKKYIREAEAEPNFWFLPFPVASYDKLSSSMSKMAELLHLLAKCMALVAAEHSRELGSDARHGEHLGQLKKVIGSSTRSFAEVIEVKSLERLDKEWRRKTSTDVENGKTLEVYGALGADEEECEKMVSSFLQHSREVVEELDASGGTGGDEYSKSKLVLCLATIGFCMKGLMRETRELELGIVELLQRENPRAHINLYAIYCKIKELST